MDKIQEINSICIGWSSNVHIEFFKDILSNKNVNSICICGVYHGRDIAYLKHIANTIGKKDIKIVGVDLFSDQAGADWGEDKKTLSWEEFCGMPSPTLEKATNNLEKLNLFSNVELLKVKDYDFLTTTKEKFDFIYLDTSHDYTTVKNSIDASINCLSEIGIIAGDDFIDSNTWGVASAVKNSFSDYIQFGPCWLSNRKNYIG